jgi:hypothetical protein
MHSAWLKGYKDKEARRKEIMGYRNGFDELKGILERDFKKKENVRDYGDPQWPHLQIAANEYNAALADIMKLLEIKGDR